MAFSFFPHRVGQGGRQSNPGGPLRARSGGAFQARARFRLPVERPHEKGVPFDKLRTNGLSYERRPARPRHTPFERKREAIRWRRAIPSAVRAELVEVLFFIFRCVARSEVQPFDKLRANGVGVGLGAIGMN